MVKSKVMEMIGHEHDTSGEVKGDEKGVGHVVQNLAEDVKVHGKDSFKSSWKGPLQYMRIGPQSFVIW